MDDSLALQKLRSYIDISKSCYYHATPVRLMASLLESIINCTRKWQIDNENLKAHLDQIQIKYQDACNYFENLWSTKDEDEYQNSYAIHKFPKKIKLVNPDIREVYNILSNDHMRSNVVLVQTDEVQAMKFLESLLKNTKDLLEYGKNTISAFHLNKELEDVEKTLKFLRYFWGFLKKRGVEKRIKDLPVLVEAAAFNMACLLYLWSSNHRSRGSEIEELVLEIRQKLEEQQLKIKQVQPETKKNYINALKAVSADDNPEMDELNLGFLDCLLDDLIKFSERKLGFVASVKDKLLSVYQVLEMLRYPTATNDLLKHGIALISETACAVFVLYDAERNEEMAKESISNLLLTVEKAKADARKGYEVKLVPEPLLSNFPRTNSRGFIDSLVQKLEDLVNNLGSNTNTVSPMKLAMEAVCNELISLRDEFNEIPTIPREHEELDHLWTHFSDIAYQVEYVIDLNAVEELHPFKFRFGLIDLTDNIKMIRAELRNVQSKTTSDDNPSSGQQISSIPGDYLSSDLLLSPDDYAVDGTKNPNLELVSFEDAAERILNQLTSDEDELQIVSIVGLPGIGKTTLAACLYDHPSVMSCFRTRARVTISKVYERRRVLLDILQGVTRDTKKLDKEGDEGLEDVLYKSLKGRRYLIVIDDIWDIKAWSVIKACFQDDKQGSRIIFTSRSLNIASQAKQGSISYQLKLLSEEKSWEMLSSKLFKKKEICPEALLEVGQDIARSCKGLPLTIDLIAGVLRSTERKESSWRLVAENIRSHIADDPLQRCQKALELSYKDLPDHLKSCFLYFGAFPEDAEVPTKRLIWLWMAEGFVKLQNDSERLENIAEAYLNHLIARSLVTISKRRSLGGVKSNRVHDLLHDFASKNAEEEFFLLQIKGQTDLSSCDYTNEGYRMFCNSSNWTQFDDGSRPFCPRVRSILLYLRHLPKNKRTSLTFNFSSFRLLRVLDLQDIEKINSDPSTSISLMIHLKFIALSAILQGWFLSLLPGLKSLETVLLVGRRMRIITLNNIWKLSKLRHFHVGYCILQLLNPHSMVEDIKLWDFLSLSTPCLCCDEETERMLRRLPNLQKLSCTVIDSWDYSKKRNLFPKIDFLEQLYSLKMVYVGKVQHPVSEVSFPPHLKKLTLSEFRLPWTEISTIAKLKKLEVLKLRIRAFEGEVWKMRDGEFPSLKVLSLCKLDIEMWNADEVEDDFPPLEYLEVFNCKSLVELPYFLANVPTLKAIRLWQCSPSLETSAEGIVKAQKENENEEIEEIKQDPPAKSGRNDRMEFLSLSH